MCGKGVAKQWGVDETLVVEWKIKEQQKQISGEEGMH
jgi:hypothetical protein